VKLLIDENLGARLVELLAEEFPGSVHVEQALGRGCADADVWQHAIANGFAIVSKDNDFRQRSFEFFTNLRKRLCRANLDVLDGDCF